jgi:hypothetical protein
LTGNAAIFALAGFLLTLSVVGWRYFVAGIPHDIAEYVSYAFPLAAALVAALTVYFESVKGLLFLLALVMLFLGLDAFIATHSNIETIMFACNLVVEGIVLLSVIVMGIRSGRKAMLTTISLALIFGFAMIYSVAFYAHNIDCVRADPATNMILVCPHSVWPSSLPEIIRRLAAQFR